MPASNRAGAFVITPTFDTSITTAPNASAIEGSIQSVINTYDSLITDSVSVSIFFSVGDLPPQFLSYNFNTLYLVSYDAYTSLLAQHAALTHNPVLTTAVADLPSGNQAASVAVSSVDLRVFGVDAPGARGADAGLGNGSFDGVISLSPDTLLQYSRPVAPTEIDARWAIAHEIDEVLGVGGEASILNIAVNTGQTSPPFFGGVIGTEDLYRYAAPGVPSLTESPDATAYFSIDGGRTELALFNQDQAFDYADWAFDFFCHAPVALVQAAVFCFGLNVDMTASSPEAVALQAIGYDLASVPEPTTGFILLAALSGLAVCLRKRRRDAPPVSDILTGL